MCNEKLSQQNEIVTWPVSPTFLVRSIISKYDVSSM